MHNTPNCLNGNKKDIFLYTSINNKSFAKLRVTWHKDTKSNKTSENNQVLHLDQM